MKIPTTVEKHITFSHSDMLKLQKDTDMSDKQLIGVAKSIRTKLGKQNKQIVVISNPERTF